MTENNGTSWLSLIDTLLNIILAEDSLINYSILEKDDANHPFKYSKDNDWNSISFVKFAK
ncbi:MAG: hypothetical protein WKF36_01195 [Candidatus Nitrosocosmicus sp.]